MWRSAAGQSKACRVNRSHQAHLPLSHHVCQADADGRQHAGVTVDEYGAHAQAPGDGASMLAARTTKAGQHMVGYIVPPHLRQSTDRPAHGLIGHLDKALRHLQGPHRCA